jgi:hypothetical protein
MTEAEWIGWDNFGPLLRHLRAIQYEMGFSVAVQATADLHAMRQ